MSDMNNLAHPYASAVFELAKSTKRLEDWLSYLNKLSMLSQNSEFSSLIHNPKITREALLSLLLETSGSKDVEVEKFLNLLYTNARLNILSEIYNLYEKLIENYKNTGKALIKSAFAMSDNEIRQIEQLLSKKFGRVISAKVTINPELIGGIKIMIDDLVIESSIKGSLEKMATQLMK